MKNTIKRVLSIILAMAMMTIPAFAIVSPEDAVPMLTERELIRLKTRELLQVRIQREIKDLTPQEMIELNNRENVIIEEIESLGGDYVTSEELKRDYFNTDESIASPNFDGLTSNIDTSYVVAGPYSYTYNGRTYYYMDITATPYTVNSYLWNNQSEIWNLYVSDLQYSEFKYTTFESYPNCEYLRPVDILSGVPNNAMGDYEVEAHALTSVNYIYIGLQRSESMSDYALALISTAVEIYQIHNYWVDGTVYAGDAFDCILYHNFRDVDFAFRCLNNGSAPFTRAPQSLPYSFGDEFLGDISVVQPLSSPYMYD